MGKQNILEEKTMNSTLPLGFINIGGCVAKGTPSYDYAEIAEFYFFIL